MCLLLLISAFDIIIVTYKESGESMKKFITVFLLQCLLLAGLTNAQAAESAVVKESFDTGAIIGNLSLKNYGMFDSSFSGGFAGKEAEDKSLEFSRKASASENSIYTMVYSTLTMKYIKYELNFFPASDVFSSIAFKTGSNKNISPAIYCKDSGDGQYNLLNRNQWNKITYIVSLDSTTVDKTKREVPCKADLYINGKQICKASPYTLYKDAAGKTTAPIRFLITGETAGSEMKTYIDDVDVCRYSADPEIKQMPALTANDGAEIIGSKYVTYQNTRVSDLAYPTDCAITVFGNSDYNNPLAENASLSENDLIALRDSDNQISYYTVSIKGLNRAQITPYSDRITASAYLDNAVLLLAGYSENGILAATALSDSQGKVNISIDGSFSSAKAFVFDSMESLKPLAEAEEYVSKPIVACWGDSLTEGQGSTDFRNGGTYAYPGVLKTLTGFDVYNMGSSGETAMSIAAREGAINVLLENDITIPADCTPVRIEFKGYNADGSYAGTVTPRNSKDWNPCIINGIEGKLSFKVNTNVNPRVLEWAEFTRSAPGESVTAAKGSQLLMPNNFNVTKNADINIIFIGTNGVWNADNTSGDDYADDLVILINKMLAKTKNPDKYIVIGLTTGNGSRYAKTDATLKAAYGKHLILPKERLATEQVLTDNNITPTEQDMADIAEGRVPASLRLASGDVHFNDIGYAELAKLVYAKMLDLGYCIK